MRSFLRSSLGIGVAAVTVGGLLTALPPPATASSPGPDRRVIVELSGEPAASSAGRLEAADAPAVRTGRRTLGSEQQRFLDRAADAGVRAGSVRRLDLLVNAVAMTVPAGQVGELAALPGVTSVVPDTPVHVQTDVSVPLIGAPEVWKSTSPAGRAVRGAGVTIAVIDSGIDYTHPDLGGGFGPGHKVVAGHDFVNNDDDPMDDNGHGTHVSGIIAGRAAKAGGITGVAPDATLTAYKVMDENGSGYTSDIIAGLEAATDPANPHRADVINMSIGGPGDGTDPLGRAATAAVRAGVVVVAAAGNDGPGADTVSSPGSADGVIAVGASTSNLRLPSAYTTGAKPELLQTYRGVISANPPVKPVTARVVDIGAGTADDWRRAGDVRGKIVLTSANVPQVLEMLSGDHVLLAREAEQRGAIALLGGPPSGSSSPQSVPAERGVVPALPSGPAVAESGDSLRMDKLVTLGMDQFQYAELTGKLAGGKLELTLRGTDVTDQIASFSSRGPSPRFQLKPDLVAPGVEILSTMPTSLWTAGQYRMSGTSMASPHVAGAAALLRQLHPGQTPAQVTSALVGTAAPLTGSGVTTQGAGRLDVAAAARSVLTASPATLSFGLADLSKATLNDSRTVTLSNSGTSRLSVTLKTTGDAKVSPDKVSIAAGRTARVTVAVKAGRPEAAAEIAGRVTATAGHGPAITVPYLLVARPLTVQTTPDPSDGHSTVYVYSPTALKSPPTVTVTPPRGKPSTVVTTLDHDTWYTAPVTGTAAGTYRVSTQATAATGQRLIGSDAFEVTPPGSRDDAWQPVGPNSSSGAVTQVPGVPGQAVLTEAGKAAPWITTDSGKTWNQRARLPVSGGTGTMIIDSKQPKQWWYSVNDGDPAADQGRVLRTRDQGRTWTTLDLPHTRTTAFVSDPQTRVLVAVSGADLRVSTDAGDTWTSYPAGVDGTITDAAIGGDDLYLATFDGVWVRPGITGGTPGPARKIYDPGFGVTDIAADADAIALYVIGDGVVSSQDKGATWSTTLDLPYTGNSLVADGGDLFIGAGSDNTSYVSHDHGLTWSDLPLPAPKSLLTDYDHWSDGSVTVSSENDGLYRGASDGAGFRRIGVQGQTANDLAVSDGNLLAGTATGLYRTELPVISPEWGRSGSEGMVGDTVLRLAVDPEHPRVVWKVVASAFDDFLVDRSADGGKTWQRMGSYSGSASALLIDPADPDRVYVSFDSLDGPGLYTTSDSGGSWKVLHQAAPYDALTADPAHAGRLWLGNSEGLYRSDDGGTTVARAADGPVTAIELDGPRLIVGGDGIRVSTDSGRTFRTADTGGLPTRVPDVLRIGKVLYAASAPFRANGLARNGRGVLRSTDNGLSWENISGGLQNLDATRLAAGPDGSSLYVGTVNGGVHRLTLSR
jgi:subtilisin family serine protease